MWSTLPLLQPERAAGMERVEISGPAGRLDVTPVLRLFVAT